MASSQALSAATHERKARLAQLQSLKRKQPDSNPDAPQPPPSSSSPPPPTTSTSTPHLSGRNYDPVTKTARLGFDSAPHTSQPTLEDRASVLAAATARQAAADASAARALDVAALQPRKPHWDLRRDLERRLDVLGPRTERAIAALVRERVGRQRVAGRTLVEATNVREREGREEGRRRERREEEEVVE